MLCCGIRGDAGGGHDYRRCSAVCRAGDAVGDAALLAASRGGGAGVVLAHRRGGRRVVGYRRLPRAGWLMNYPLDPNDPFDPRLEKHDCSVEINAGLAFLVRHFDAKPAYRSYNCQDCGNPIKAITYASGRREILDATTFEQHCCPRPARLQPTLRQSPPPAPAVRRDPPPRPPSRPEDKPKKPRRTAE